MLGTLGLLLLDGTPVATGPVLALAIAQAPTAAITGTVFTPSFVIELQSDGVATGATVDVTVAVATGTGTLTGTLTRSSGGASTVTFPDLQIAVGTGNHTFTFSAPSYTSVTSSTVAVTAPGTPIGPTTGPATGNGLKRRRGWGR